jgi:predicted Ser/Thr protein kinase
MAITVAIEGYDSLEQIGIGGMAAVYRARKVSIDKTVAIKVLFPYLATDQSFIERFQREAKAAASIQHENVVNVIDFGESEGSFYIVMEYYDGRTLEQLMKERPGLPPEITIQILLEVAYGLEAAHALDIVHRDIKPANIIYTNQGGIKIADFGLARKSDSMTMITQHGKVLGTPAYMSPEQAAGRPVGPASDIFSFGVVAYELLGRKKPFEGQSYSEVLDRIQTHDPPPVTIANPLVALEFERIVQRALAKEESERYPGASALIADLEAAMDKNQIRRDRRRLVTYAKDPDQYDATFAETTIAQCLSRGAFFMQKGNTHLKDAVLEYRRVLFIDPGHARARASLIRLQGESADDGRTQTLNALPHNGRAARGTPAHARAPQPARTRHAPRWLYGVVAVVITGGGATLAWRASPTNGSREPAPAMDATVHVQRAAQVGEPVGLVPSREPAVSLADTTSRVATNEPPAMTADLPAKKKSPAPKVQSKPASENQRRPVPADPPAPTAAPGLLSVYFLGGVGELWVDGKLFSRQPPFEKASIAAGVHRVACRMSGDETRRELTVEIRPGRETVVEYETGGEPVVAEE